MSLVDGLLTMLRSIESDAIAIHEERCVSVRNRNAGCLRCAETCTSGAIAFLDNQIKVEPHLCISCGTCATACPTCAIEIRNPSDDELTVMIKRSIATTDGHPVIACDQVLSLAGPRAKGAAVKRRGSVFARARADSIHDTSQVVTLPCLGRVDESVLVGMAAYKASDVLLACGDCETCQHAPGGAMVRQVIDGARNMLKAFDAPLDIELVDRLPERVHMVRDGDTQDFGGVSRRDFLQTAKNNSAHAASAALGREVSAALGEDEFPMCAAFPKVGADGTLSHFVPTRRLRLYNYLKHIGKPVADHVETRLIGTVSIDEHRCSSCRMCAVFCPTGAIAKLDERDGFGIVHRPSACMQCRLCERICPEQAIEVSGLVPMRQFMGKEAVGYTMKRPTWTPNRPASMYEKMHSVIGEDLEMCMF